ncbi:MAG TPA: hypothetical protein VE377_24265 [Candidatus Dormibacteraeota bacterium]|nr:hypothetical protein [Candidatus Dormibacteraeota bacterium]
MPITPSLWARSPSRGYAAETVELSHQLNGTLRIYRGDHLLVALPLPWKNTPSAALR